MVGTAVATCQVGGPFSRCANPSVNSCQYCARKFCERHTYVLEAIEAVCTRRRCRNKHDDLQAHMAYRDRVRQRNHAGLCGEEDCGPHPGHECSLCNGVFCDRHVRERNYPLRDGSVIIDRPVSVCGWCWQRRKVWRR